MVKHAHLIPVVSCCDELDTYLKFLTHSLDLS